ncbi:iron ABC transporter permease [Endozoicomonas sp. G2_1]|uniref:FecCD family ABC transporter permease n=1 Tax=Endozoicomonas sp. G2_1 TaxID=2821091 RepID=UPI001ADA952A|nr:iron ABC transporter permease [Endozoicomonas sp. G2_1]MBO9491520.1 iron ABC transporter permease [Endozoicomonas sp. G2_1]
MNSVAQVFAKQQQHSTVWQLTIVAFVLVLAVVALGFGPAGWDWRLAFAWPFSPETFGFSELQLQVVTQIRFPRLCVAIVIGAVLAQSGTATQSLCRNPLAEPSIIGISAGAAVFAVAVIAFAPRFGYSPDLILPYAAFAGALLTTCLVYFLANRNGDMQVITLILVGVAINALAMALIGLFSFYADDNALRLINYWTLGSLAGATWPTILQALPLLLLSLAGLYWRQSQINILLLGESEAKYLGIDTRKLKREIIIWVALGIGAAVALSGMIGFVGLVMPHIARLIVGPNLKQMLPLAMLLGALMLLLADWLARVLVAPAELPIGIITAMIGAPLFVYLLLEQQRGRRG